MSAFNRLERGFTLIELMVVLIISSLLLSLVGPLALERIDAYRAKKELLDIRQKMRDVSNQAYVSGQLYQVRMQGTELSIKSASQQSSYVYKFISAEDLYVSFNRNGFPDVAVVKLKNRGREERLVLIELIGLKPDDYVHIQ
ncbi:prepilin-type N-terminal cleavage/methylation domain-containing protein [Rheinheimera sp.]|uniref:prepilin-type N-terminal cleavage/methylation domain-containing protein n=1 Tax=Rheinheimera sp. TaxID=1869214 RepID=UPI003AF655F5